MGYCMSQRDCNFFIAKENKEKALQAIKDLANIVQEKGGGGGWVGEKKVKWFAWVTTENFVNAKTLEEAMNEWRWEINSDDNGDIVGISFVGEKLGDDMILFNAIAPYIKEGSFIDMSGEDGYMWRWKFDGEKVKEIEGTVTFED